MTELELQLHADTDDDLAAPPWADEKLPLMTAERFCFELPLFKWVKVEDTTYDATFDNDQAIAIDGYCPECEKNSTFVCARFRPLKTIIRHGMFREDDGRYLRIANLNCVRDESHQIIICYVQEGPSLIKIGQWPSLADITKDASKKYSKVLGDLTGDYSKAIGLAAHGVGIGAFVYLRRVFEKLVWNCFNRNKDAEGWDEAEFRGKRMAERIKFLKEFLPDFLVDNPPIYSILSLGIHELDEEDCKAHFVLLKMSIEFILDDELVTRAKEAKRQQVMEELKKLKGTGSGKTS